IVSRMFAGERVKLLALGRVKLDPSTRGIWVTLGPIVLNELNPFSVVLLPDLLCLASSFGLVVR
ncbi:MAG: hypothetical protein LC130_00150, partial [Bryobacterales bacterium]|nr:hypothetical protein [Bryobacterales bacterium]